MFSDEAREHAEALTAAGIRATHDPVWAQTHRPCVLVTPPSRDYARLATTWRLVALASTDAPSLKAFEELSGLVAQLEQAVNVEQADPAQYPLTSGAQPVPAYVVRVTT